MPETKPWPRAQRMSFVMAGERPQPHHYQAIAEYDEARGEATERYSCHGGHAEYTAAQVNQAIEWWNKRAVLEAHVALPEPPSAMIEASRRAHALELATDLVAAREQGRGSIFSASVLAGDVVDVARCFENYLRGGGDA